MVEKLHAGGFFESLKKEISTFKKNDATSAIAWFILGHAFMKFQDILGVPWGKRGNYDLFFSLLEINLPVMAEFNEEEKAMLKEDGWRKYLDD